MPLEFFMAITPPTTTSQMKRIRIRNGKPTFYDSRKMKAARNEFHAHLLQFQPGTPIEGAIRLITKWCYPTSKQHPGPKYKITRPDTDNMIKMLKDEMTKAGFWLDDAQVASEITEKFWADPPGIYVRVEQLENKI